MIGIPPSFHGRGAGNSWLDMSTISGSPEAARLLSLADLRNGASYQELIELTAERLEAFKSLSRDHAPIHVSPEHAGRLGFQGIVIHGFLVAVFYSRILGMFLPGGNTVLHSLDLKMLAPSYVGDTLTYRVTVKRVVPAVSTVHLSLEATNQDGIVVSVGSANCVFRA